MQSPPSCASARTSAPPSSSRPAIAQISFYGPCSTSGSAAPSPSPVCARCAWAGMLLSPQGAAAAAGAQAPPLSNSGSAPCANGARDAAATLLVEHAQQQAAHNARPAGTAIGPAVAAEAGAVPSISTAAAATAAMDATQDRMAQSQQTQEGQQQQPQAARARPKVVRQLFGSDVASAGAAPQGTAQTAAAAAAVPRARLAVSRRVLSAVDEEEALMFSSDPRPVSQAVATGTVAGSVSRGALSARGVQGGGGRMSSEGSGRGGAAVLDRLLQQRRGNRGNTGGNTGGAAATAATEAQGSPSTSRKRPPPTMGLLAKKPRSPHRSQGGSRKSSQASGWAALGVGSGGKGKGGKAGSPRLKKQRQALTAAGWLDMAAAAGTAGHEGLGLGGGGGGNGAEGGASDASSSDENEARVFRGRGAGRDVSGNLGTSSLLGSFYGPGTGGR